MHLSKGEEWIYNYVVHNKRGLLTDDIIEEFNKFICVSALMFVWFLFRIKILRPRCSQEITNDNLLFVRDWVYVSSLQHVRWVGITGILYSCTYWSFSVYFNNDINSCICLSK